MSESAKPLVGALVALRGSASTVASWLSRPAKARADLAAYFRAVRANPRRAIGPGAGLAAVALAGSFLFALA
jgi:hypothetical protein